MITNILANPEPITEWNKLPSTTINTPSVETFKDRLKFMPLCALVTSAFILQPYHVNHKEVLLVNYSDSDIIR